MTYPDGYALTTSHVSLWMDGVFGPRGRLFWKPDGISPVVRFIPILHRALWALVFNLVPAAQKRRSCLLQVALGEIDHPLTGYRLGTIFDKQFSE